MKLHNKGELKEFARKHADLDAHADTWIQEVEDAHWTSPLELKAKYPRASIISGNQVVFDLCGNKYRLLAIISYKNQIMVIEKVDKHNKYDKWKL